MVTQRDRRNPLTLRMAEPVAAVAENRGGAKLPYTQIRTDGGTQMRAGLNEATAAEYADELRRGAVFPPVLVFFDGQTYWLGDGFHRVRAYFLAYGDQVGVPCEVRPGTRRDAVLCAAGANAVHGLRRTNADKRRAVEALLRDEEWGQWSDREIARRCHVHHDLVGGLRKAILADSAAIARDGDDSSLAGSASEKASQRLYITKHGTVASMRTANIGQTSSPSAMVERQPLSLDEAMALIRSAVRRGVGADSAAQLRWLEAQRGYGHYEPLVKGDRSLPVEAFRVAYARVVEEVSQQIDEPSENEDAEGRAEPVVRPKPHSNGASPVLAGGLPTNGAQHGAVRRAELLALYRQVLSTLGEYGALTGMHTHTPAVRRALEPLIEELRKT